MRRRAFTTLATGLLASPALAQVSNTQAPYPNRPIRMIVPFVGDHDQAQS